MSSQDNDQDSRVVAVVLVSAILLAVGLALGFGISKARKGGAEDAPKSAAAVPAAVADVPAGAPAAVVGAPEAPVGNDASVVVDNGVVKFYFASGKSDLAPGALDALGDAVAAAKQGKKLVISGFHDTTGNPAQNAELAKQRAFAVRDALKGAGVDEASLELKKPEEAAAGVGSDAEARRVEVVIAQ
jgi:outer membrane protein OmpA-like peptidoglycan-associated protein